MLSHTYKFIFVHVPKSGGTSIMRTLRPYDLLGEGHYTLNEIKRNNNMSDLQAQAYFKFAVVRNPWDVVVSNYHYSRMKKSFWHSDDNTTRYSMHPDYELVSKIGFTQYVQLCVTNKLHHRFAMMPQSHWIDDITDYLIRFESLDKDFAKVCQQIGIGPVLLEKINPTKHDHYSKYYDDTSIELVANYFSRDIEQFGYRFERE